MTLSFIYVKLVNMKKPSGAYSKRPYRKAARADAEAATHAATVATDLSTWKLLRRDLGLELARVAEVMTELLHGLERRR